MKKLLILGILCSLSFGVNAKVWKCSFNEQARLHPIEGIVVSNNLNFELMFEINDNKVNVIKAVREITGLGLKEAKDIVDAAPKVVKETLAKADADEAMKKLTDAGATAELK